jgi:putative hydrolase of the HAD superfamily
LTAEECVFLDDRLENIEAAEKIGFKGIVFTSAQEARSGLEKLKIRIES